MRTPKEYSDNVKNRIITKNMLEESDVETLSIKEAAELTSQLAHDSSIGKSEGSIREWLKKGYIRGCKDNVIKVYKQDLLAFVNDKEKRGSCSPFGQALPREDELFMPLYTLKQGYISFSTKKIMIGSLGTIWNVTDSHIYGESAIDTNGHIQIRIDGVLYYPHRLIALSYCANRRFKQIVHHINGIPTDNRKENLMWVTDKEHKMLHKLLNKNKQNEYKRLLNEIKSDNDWDNGKKLYSIIDENMSDEYSLDVYMTNYDGFKLLLQGFGIDELIRNQLICKEYFCPNEGKKQQ